MNPKIFASPFRSLAYAREFPYIAPSFGKHVGALQDSELEQQRTEFLTANRQILPGWGKHRLTRNDLRPVA